MPYAKRLTSLLLVFAVASDVLPAQSKSRDPKVKESLERFLDAIRAKDFAQDNEAVRIIDELLPQYEGMHPRDQADFMKALTRVFSGKKREPGEPILYKATITALGTLGEDAGKLLVKIYQRSPFDKERDWVAMRETILASIGRTRDEKQAEFLLERALRDHNDRIKAAAGKALGEYEDSDYDLRKDLVKQLIRNYGKIEGDSRSPQINEINVIVRRQTLQTIADPWNTALSRLTTVSFRTAEEWQHWYNKNKDDREAWGVKRGSEPR